MSAWVVDDAHVDAMLTAGLSLGVYGPLRWWLPADDMRRQWDRRLELTEETAGRVGAMLLAENQRSVNTRYADDGWEPPYQFRRLPGYDHAEHALAMMKAVSCYEYQACENDDYWQSEAHAFCAALVHALVAELPGYDELPWGIDSPDVFLVLSGRVVS